MTSRYHKPLLLAALALLPALLSAATEVHVAPEPTGNDANLGTALQPVATPKGAQVRLRALIQAGLSNAVEVIFAAGTYQMDAPLAAQSFFCKMF